MLTDARNRSGLGHPNRPALTARAILAGFTRFTGVAGLALVLTGCAEVEVGAEAYKTFHRANNPSMTGPAASASARHASMNPALQPDRAAFHATGVAVWNGGVTLPGLWVAHPMATTARRVRLTNQQTGQQADAALLRRDPGAPGPSIAVSSEAARAIGLRPGQATPVTIEGLVHAPSPDTPAGNLETTRLAAASLAPASGAATAAQSPHSYPQPPQQSLAQPDNIVPYAADAVLTAERESPTAPLTQPVAQSVPQRAAQPTAQPKVQPAAGPAAADITDGRHYIQAGVFRDPENAAQLAATLTAAALPVHNQALTLGGRAATRVLVGPYATVAERNAALATVRALGPADAIPARG